ncbi:ATP-dependent DNA ligase [Clostridiaceae bacterium M8S5]|nr:ATP-dependent DNA ligase [Clostridiaceae bacterium M8S5]
MLEIMPMEPIKSTTIPQGSDWVHEIKFDGIRGLLIYNQDDFKLYTKKGYDITLKFPEITNFKYVFSGKSSIIDGELTVFKEDRHSFHDILVRARSSSELKIKSNIAKYPLTYVVFDILSYNGEDLSYQPLAMRKKILKDSIEQTNNFLYSDYYEDGNALFDKVKSLGYEGIVSKKIDSPYVPYKKHRYWYKIKVKKKILCVIGGINLEGNKVKSLLLGMYNGNNLIYIGNASSGLSQNDLSLLYGNLDSLRSNHNPFSNISKSKSIVFTKPLLTCWIKYSEWTDKGKLRHPQIIGFSDLLPSNANGVEFIL